MKNMSKKEYFNISSSRNEMRYSQVAVPLLFTLSQETCKKKKKEMTALFTRYTTDINSVKDFYSIFKKNKKKLSII